MKRNNFELIEDYILGVLNESERVDFVKRLREDALFKQEYEDAKKVINSIESYGLINDFERFHSELDLKEGISNPTRNRFYAVGIAASILLLLTLGLLLFKGNLPPNNYYSYFDPYPNLLSRRGDVKSPELVVALDAYNKKDFAIAVRSFENYLSETSGTSDVKFYYALSLFGNEEPAKALALLNSIEDEKYSEQLNWYKALCLLALNKYDQATTQLEKISEGNFEFQRSQEILHHLELQKDLH